MSEEPNSPPAPEESWRSYKEKGKDSAERIIEAIVAQAPDFVIYTTMGDAERRFPFWTQHIPVLDYHIEGTYAAREKLSEANVLASKIHSLAPRKSQHRVIIDKQLYAGYERVLRDHPVECQQILNDILDQLTATQTTKGQLRYIVTNVAGCAIAWIGYCVHQHRDPNTPIVGNWLLAGALGTTGGVLSVAIKLKDININVHQHWFLQCFAGWTRNVVAFLGGVACLLAIRAKVALGMAAPTIASGVSSDVAKAPLEMLEVFFCFLAGFSESLVPNILRDSEKNARKNEADESAQTKTTDAENDNKKRAAAEKTTAGAAAEPQKPNG